MLAVCPARMKSHAAQAMLAQDFPLEAPKLPITTCKAFRSSAGGDNKPQGRYLALKSVQEGMGTHTSPCSMKCPGGVTTRGQNKERIPSSTQGRSSCLLGGGQRVVLVGRRLLNLQHALPRGDAGDKPWHNPNRGWMFLKGRTSTVVMYFWKDTEPFCSCCPPAAALEGVRHGLPKRCSFWDRTIFWGYFNTSSKAYSRGLLEKGHSQRNNPVCPSATAAFVAPCTAPQHPCSRGSTRLSAGSGPWGRCLLPGGLRGDAGGALLRTGSKAGDAREGICLPRNLHLRLCPFPCQAPGRKSGSGPLRAQSKAANLNQLSTG